MIKKNKKGILLKLFLFSIIILWVCCNQKTQQNQIFQNTSSLDTNTWQNVTQKNIYNKLNEEIQTLNENFIYNFLSYYHVQQSVLQKILNEEALASELDVSKIDMQTGGYLLLLGKMYLYNMLPKSQLTDATWNMYASQSRYLLAYFYLKVAAQKYENSQAYYYLALLDYYKLTPHQTVISNIEREISRIQKQQGYEKAHSLHYQQLLDHLRNHRFMAVQHNLFLSSLLGHTGASLVLANMNKEGLGIDKNCTTALAYYLSVVKNTYVDFYEFRSSYSDQKNFEKQLYSKRKVNFLNEQSAQVVSESQFFDTQTIKATFQLAQNYFIGRAGFKKNYQKAAQLYAKLAGQDHKNSMAMLGMCYFKGQGVPVDRKRARVLFQSSNKVSISEAMLIVMDYFQIQSKGNKQYAIKRMTGKRLNKLEIYNKNKDNMNSILKYLFGSLIVKGDVKDIKTDEGVLLLGSAAKEGHLMAKIAMGLLFSDGIDVNYDCNRAVNYFSQEAMSHPFFMDKFYMARIGLKNEHKIFSLIKYLQLSLIGDTNSFINALYILEIQKQSSLELYQNSWNLKIASQNQLYQKLKKFNIVPDIKAYLLKQYNFIGKNNIKYSLLEKFLQGSKQVIDNHFTYMKKKIIKVCAITKENSLMNFYEYKMTPRTDTTLLSTISNGQPTKLHVLESRYLLGQIFHKKSFESLSKGKDHTKDQYKALQQYKRSTNSQILGKILFYLQQIKLNPYGINFDDQLFKFGFVDDLLTFTFILSIVIFVLYYKRSKKLDEIHRKQLEKRLEEQRQRKQAQQFNRKKQQTTFQHILQPQILKEKESQFSSNEELSESLNQPEIIEQTSTSKGYRIGSSLQDQEFSILQNYRKNQNTKKQQEDKEEEKKEK